MDKQNFDLIINRYLEKFEYTNGKGPEEYFKWKAIDCFRNNWDINSDDLLDSFTRAVKETSVLLDGGHSAPSSGIKYLLRIPAEVEFVRDAFRELLDPSTDLKERDQRVHKFIFDLNSRISKYRPNDGYMPQTSRAALCYLTLAYPDKNFFYMFTKAENWAVFTEYGWDLGSGENFSLPVYYQMCEELVGAIKESSELQICDKARRDKVGASFYDNYHTLAYDIIYCATTYHLFRDLPIFYPIGVKNRVERARELEEIEKLRAEMLYAEKRVIEFDAAEWKPLNLIGHDVRHKRFGSGVIVEQTGTGLVVHFGEDSKKFVYPDAFIQGHLQPSESDVNAIRMGEENRKERELAEKLLDTKKEAYSRAIAEFEKKWKKSVHNEAVGENDD